MKIVIGIVMLALLAGAACDVSGAVSKELEITED